MITSNILSRLQEFLYPTLLAAINDNKENKDVIKSQMNLSLLTGYLNQCKAREETVKDLRDERNMSFSSNNSNMFDINTGNDAFYPVTQRLERSFMAEILKFLEEK